VGPLGPGAGEDAHALARLDPEVDEAEGDLLDSLRELRVGDVVPRAVALVADRHALAVRRDGRGQQVGDRAGARDPFGGRRERLSGRRLSRRRVRRVLRGACLHGLVLLRR